MILVPALVMDSDDFRLKPMGKHYGGHCIEKRQQI